MASTMKMGHMGSTDGTYVYAVIRATRSTSEWKGLYSTQEGAQRAADRMNITFPRGARCEVCRVRVED